MDINLSFIRQKPIVEKLENGCFKHVFYYDGSALSCEMYFNSKKELYRLDGPAYISYWESSGYPLYEEYYVNNKRHNIKGPAIIERDISGNIISEDYYINDIEYSKEEYNKIINIDKNLRLLNKK